MAVAAGVAEPVQVHGSERGRRVGGTQPGPAGRRRSRRSRRPPSQAARVSRAVTPSRAAPDRLQRTASLPGAVQADHGVRLISRTSAISAGVSLLPRPQAEQRLGVLQWAASPSPRRAVYGPVSAGPPSAPSSGGSTTEIPSAPPPLAAPRVGQASPRHAVAPAATRRVVAARRRTAVSAASSARSPWSTGRGRGGCARLRPVAGRSSHGSRCHVPAHRPAAGTRWCGWSSAMSRSTGTADAGSGRQARPCATRVSSIIAAPSASRWRTASPGTRRVGHVHRVRLVHHPPLLAASCSATARSSR